MNKILYLKIQINYYRNYNIPGQFTYSNNNLTINENLPSNIYNFTIQGLEYMKKPTITNNTNKTIKINVADASGNIKSSYLVNSKNCASNCNFCSLCSGYCSGGKCDTQDDFEQRMNNTGNSNCSGCWQNGGCSGACG